MQWFTVDVMATHKRELEQGECYPDVEVKDQDDIVRGEINGLSA